MMLVYTSVAALFLSREWEMTYAGLIPYATPGFVAFGVCLVTCGLLADKWSRSGMMIVFYLGIGLNTVVLEYHISQLKHAPPSAIIT